MRCQSIAAYVAGELAKCLALMSVPAATRRCESLVAQHCLRSSWHTRVMPAINQHHCRQHSNRWKLERLRHGVTKRTCDCGTASAVPCVQPDLGLVQRVLSAPCRAVDAGVTLCKPHGAGIQLRLRHDDGP